MKTQILLISLLFLSPICFAQVKFGVFIDPQFTWLSPESRSVESKGLKFGVNGGLSVDNYFAKNYAFSSGLALGTQGGKLLFENEKVISAYSTQDTLPAGTTVDYSLQYISIPLGLKLKSNQIGYATFFVNLGFTNQFNLKAKASTSNPGGLENDAIKKEVFWYNLSYHFGGGVEYSIGEDTAISLAVIHHNGFIDITTTNPRINSRVLSIRLGVLF